MRKTFAIVFIILLLFNILGYYGLFLGLQYSHDARMIQRLDSDSYDISQTITIKIPITIPYASDSRDFQRIDGEFEHNGVFYRMVKQRLLRDTLYIVCIEDVETKRINQALHNYVKTFSDKPADNHSSSKTFSTFIKDYLTRPFSVNCSTPGWECDVLRTTSSAVFISSFYSSIIHPPERI